MPESSLERTVDRSEQLIEWTTGIDGNITCPPEAMGGCGRCLLELKRLLPDDWISSLEVKAEAIQTNYGTIPTMRREDFCENDGETSYRAASREGTDDNFLYCPASRDILEEEQLLRFRYHWSRGEPVIVRNVLERTSGLSWEPMVMWRALCENVDSKMSTIMSEVKAIDCLAGCEVCSNISCLHFFISNLAFGLQTLISLSPSSSRWEFFFYK